VSGVQELLESGKAQLLLKLSIPLEMAGPILALLELVDDVVGLPPLRDPLQELRRGEGGVVPSEAPMLRGLIALKSIVYF